MSGVKSASDYPRLWGIELECVYVGYDMSKGYSVSPSYECLNVGPFKRHQRMIVLTTDSPIFAHHAVGYQVFFDTIFAHTVFVDDVRDYMSFYGVLQQNGEYLGPLGVRVVINSIPVWHFLGVCLGMTHIDTVTSVFAQMIPIPESAKKKNSVWKVEIQLTRTVVEFKLLQSSILLE